MEFVGQLCSNGYEYVCHGRDRAALRGDGSLVAVATPLAAAVLGVQGVRSGSSSTILSSPSSLECSVGIIAKVCRTCLVPFLLKNKIMSLCLSV